MITFFTKESPEVFPHLWVVSGKMQGRHSHDEAKQASRRVWGKHDCSEHWRAAEGEGGRWREMEVIPNGVPQQPVMLIPDFTR